MGDLRALSVTQQVGLLFMTIFGLLVLTTLVALSRSLRERTAAQQATYWRFRRDLRAVWAGTLLFWIAWASGAFVSTLVFGVLSFLALANS